MLTMDSWWDCSYRSASVIGHVIISAKPSQRVPGLPFCSAVELIFHIITPAGRLLNAGLSLPQTAPLIFFFFLPGLWSSYVVIEIQWMEICREVKVAATFGGRLHQACIANLADTVLYCKLVD